MKSLGYAVVFAALLGGSIFMMKLLSGLEREKCARTCPSAKDAVIMTIDVGPWQYSECRCP